MTYAPRPKPSGTVPPPPTGLPPISAHQLVAVLLRTGATVISRQPHGVLLKVRKRLVFVPEALRVSDSTLGDALRTAGISPEQFAELRAASS